MNRDVSASVPTAPTASSDRARGASAAAPVSPRCVDSAQLFAGTTELLIDHRGVLYRLKQTSLGKLILTK